MSNSCLPRPGEVFPYIPALPDGQGAAWSPSRSRGTWRGLWGKLLHPMTAGDQQEWWEFSQEKGLVLRAEHGWNGMEVSPWGFGFSKMRGVEGVSGSGPAGVERGGAACGGIPGSLCAQPTPAQQIPGSWSRITAGFRSSWKWTVSELGNLQENPLPGRGETSWAAAQG